MTFNATTLHRTMSGGSIVSSSSNGGGGGGGGNKQRIITTGAMLGAYFMATYGTYRYLTSAAGSSNSDDNSNGEGGSKVRRGQDWRHPPASLPKEITLSSPSKSKSSSHITSPNRTQTFSKIASNYDTQISKDEIILGMNVLRKFLIKNHAHGNVLEVGAGTGRNIGYYLPKQKKSWWWKNRRLLWSSSDDVDNEDDMVGVDRVVMTDSSDQMLLQARSKLREMNITPTAGASSSTTKSTSSKHPSYSLHVADASHLSQYYSENEFDTVVDTFGLCSYDDPVQVLKEMKRVCRKDGKGRIILLEHGRVYDDNEESNVHVHHDNNRHEKNSCCEENGNVLIDTKTSTLNNRHEKSTNHAKENSDIISTIRKWWYQNNNNLHEYLPFHYPHLKSTFPSFHWIGLNNYLDANAERHACNWGCVWNRDLISMLQEAGYIGDYSKGQDGNGNGNGEGGDIVTFETWHFGTTYYIVCRPKDVSNSNDVGKNERITEVSKDDKSNNNNNTVDNQKFRRRWWKLW